MFDGNHRVSRREVNLSGKRKTNANKQSLLHESRQRREARRLATARTNAATRLQARQRGIAERKVLLESQLQKLEVELESFERRKASSTTGAPQKDAITPIFEALVVLSRNCCRQRNNISSWLPRYAAAVRQMASTFTNTAPPFALHVVDLTLRNASLVDFDDFRVILSYLLYLDAQGSDIKHEQYWEHRAPISFDRMAIDLLCQEPTGSPMQQFLRQCIAKILPPSREKDAITFVLALAFDDDLQHDIASSDPFEALLTLLTNNAVSSRLRDIALSLIAKNSVKILSAASELFLRKNSTIASASSLIHLYYVCLVENSALSDPIHRAVVLWAMNRVARGESLDLVVEMETDVTTQEDSDSDDDDDYNDEPTNSTAANSMSSRTAQRQELQTTAKLDRKLTTLTQQIDHWYANFALGLQSGAEKLADATLWHRLGITILKEGNDSQKSLYIVLLATILQSLTSSTSNRQTLSSQLLNKLSFSLDFIKSLWNFLATKKKTLLHSKTWTKDFIAATSVFAAVVSHYLVALRDEQFLIRHTDVKVATEIMVEEPRSIPVLDMIELYNELLYAFYMETPVTQADVQMVLGSHWSDEQLPCTGIATGSSELAAVKAQAMLNGTRLWTSLYNRWSRLVTSAKFCEESKWLFDGASNINGDIIRNEESNDMEIDDDDQLATMFRDPKVARCLSAIPMVFPFELRVQMFQSLLTRDKLLSRSSLDEEATMAIEAMLRGEDPHQAARLKIHRDHLFEDSMAQLNALGKGMKKRIQISFVNRHGAEEAGIDGGGVFREFIDDLINEAFLGEGSAERPQLFHVTPHETLTVNTDVDVSPLNLSRFEFLGRVLGKAVYESIVVEPQFCLPFLNQLLGKSNSLDDLKNLDGEYYTNLTKLLTMPVTDLEGLGLVFEANMGRTASSRAVELVPNGKQRVVSKQNVISYVHLVANFKLNVETSQQTKAFLRGFRDLIPATWVRLFSSYELQKLISGDDSLKGFDVDAFKKSMQYAAGYHPDQPIIQWFWEVVSELTPAQKHQFLKFMTSCSRQPLLGFGSLHPAPCVQQIRLPDTLFEGKNLDQISKEAPLPTSSTCMNLLKMPNYRSKELLKMKLLAAIESGAGFELT